MMAGGSPERFAEVCTERDEDNLALVHHAAYNKVDESIMEMILSTSPSCARLKDSSGQVGAATV